MLGPRGTTAAPRSLGVTRGRVVSGFLAVGLCDVYSVSAKIKTCFLFLYCCVCRGCSVHVLRLPLRSYQADANSSTLVPTNPARMLPSPTPANSLTACPRPHKNGLSTLVPFSLRERSGSCRVVEQCFVLLNPKDLSKRMHERVPSSQSFFFSSN